MENQLYVQSKYNMGFIFPALFFLLLTGIFPLIYVGIVSFIDYALNRPYEPIEFIGGMNYSNMFKDIRFINAVQKTTIYMIVTTFGSIGLGFIMAYLIWSMKNGFLKSVLRVLWAVPVFCAPVIIGHGFRYMFQIGPLNSIFGSLGILSSEPLGVMPDALIVVMLVEIWYWSAFCYMILLAGLYSIPESRLEASHTDGSWAFERLRFIILPSLKYYFLVVLLIRLMDSWRAFDFISTVTKGGPGYATETLSRYASLNAFSFWNMGYASAIGIFMLFITLTITWLFVNGYPTWLKIMAELKPKELAKTQQLKESLLVFNYNYKNVKKDDVIIPRKLTDYVKEIRIKKGNKRKIYNAFLLLLKIFFAVTIVFPYVFIIRSSFMTNQEALDIPIKWNFTPTLENFRYVLFENSVIPYQASTLVIAISVTILTLLLSIPASYALSRYKWKFNQTIFFFILTTRMAAPVVFGIPIFMLANTLRILDTYLIMIVVYCLMNVGFTIWVLKGFFEGIPREYDEIAFLQGTSKIKAFLTIDLPLAKSGIAVAAIFTFIFTWNDAFYATLLGGKNITTFAAILPSYFVRYVPQWTHLTAAGTLYIIPSVIFAILMFKLIQHGLKLKL